MKKKNGFTMVELIVSLTLISIVMVFLFRLLVDVKEEDNNATSKITFLTYQAKLTKSIQEIFIDYELLDTGAIQSCGNKCVDFFFKGDYQLRIYFYVQNEADTGITYTNEGEYKNISVVFTDRQGIKTVLSQSQIPNEDKNDPATPDKKPEGYFDTTDNFIGIINGPAKNALMKISFALKDKNGKDYPIEIYYPYDSATINITEATINTINAKF